VTELTKFFGLAFSALVPLVNGILRVIAFVLLCIAYRLRGMELKPCWKLR